MTSSSAPDLVPVEEGDPEGPDFRKALMRIGASLNLHVHCHLGE